MDPTLARTLHDALPSSPTLHRIVDEIERSDLIVHVVELPPHQRRRHQGMMQFVCSTGAHRFVRVWVDVQLPADRRAGMLGHELYHALEVARARWVVDRRSFAALYGRIGDAHIGQTVVGFETAGAGHAGRQVRQEVRRAAASARRAAIDAGGPPH